jgi:type IV secretion system protein VirB10
VTIHSPNKLEVKGTPQGIVRVSKYVKLLVVLIAVMLFALIAYGITSSGNKHKQNAYKSENNTNTKLEAATDIAQNLYKDIASNIKTKSEKGEPTVLSGSEGGTQEFEKKGHEKNIPTNDQLAIKLKEIRLQETIQARSSGVNSEAFFRSTGGQAATAAMHKEVIPQSVPYNNSIESYKQLTEYQALKDDQNKQMRKEKFLKEEAGDSFLLSAQLQKPISPYEVKSGQVIPAIMISGINSDLPGQITAQVRENVYDTVSGVHLLIPQGARLIGTYDSQIAYGQERVLIVWNRLIMPNGDSISLKAMPGADLGGYSGFADQVDHHYFKTFGSAILMSMVSAGVQISQPQTASNIQGPNTNQIITSNVGGGLAQASNGVLQKNLNVQPTIQVRPGYLFNVFVTKDLIMPGAYLDF